jgi:hypothetical protein
VKWLGFYTFHGCASLRSVALPNSELKIHGKAFHFCVGLEEIAIPEKAVKVEADAFTGCSGMRDFFVEPNNAAYTALDGILYNKERTVLIRYPEGKVLEELVIPDGVAEIGDKAFSGCGNLRAIRVPASLKKISESAFDTWDISNDPEYVQARDGVVRITVDERSDTYADIDGVLFNKEKTVLLKYPTGRTQTAYAIPDGVTEIADRAFGDREIYKIYQPITQKGEPT